jgi:WD40 repeat protein/DNA/RNA endonuclease G (NUC1)
MDNQKTTLQTVIQTGHADIVRAVCICPENEYLLSASDDSSVRLWELNSGKLIRVFSGHAGQVFSCTISSDRKYVAAADSATVKLWDFETGRELQTLDVNAAESLCFSPDGNALVVGCMDCFTTFLWDPSTLTWEISKADFFTGRSGFIRVCLLYKDDKKLLATGSDDGTTMLLDFETLAPINLFTTYPHLLEDGYEPEDPIDNPLSIRSVCFTPDGKYLVTGSNDGAVRLWDVESHTQTTPFRSFEHPGGVNAVGVSPDGRFLATAGNDKSVRWWDLMDDKKVPLAIIQEAHFAPLTAVCISPDGKYFATCSEDTFLKLWDTTTKKEIRTFTGASFAVNAVAMRNDRKYLAVGHTYNLIKIWDLAAGKLSNTLTSSKVTDENGIYLAITSLHFSRDNQSLVSASADGTAKRWDIANKEPIQTFKGHTNSLFAASISDDNQLIATVGDVPTVRLWNTVNETWEDVFGQYHNTWMKAVDINLEKNYLAAACDYGERDYPIRVIVKDLNTKEDHLLEEHTDKVTSLRISKDGKHLVTGSYLDRTARIWDMENLKASIQVLDHPEYVNSVDISADGAYIVTGSDDGCARLWDRTTGKHLGIFRGHTGCVWVSITEDAKYVISGSRDSATNIWDVQTGEKVVTLVAVGAEDWVVLHPSGLFDASPGAMQKMHYVVGLEVIELDQLKNRYWQPGLLTTLMGFDNSALKEVVSSDELPLFPKVLSLQVRDDKLEVMLEPRNGGIGKAKFFMNNKELSLFKDDGSRISDANPERKPAFSVDLQQFKNFFENGRNTLGIQTWNEDNWLPSQLHIIEFEHHSGESTEASLHAIFVGTSKYRNGSLSLTFPDQDAAYFNDALNVVGELLFPARTNLHLLTTEKPQSASFSSKENIKKAFEEVSRKARPQDVVVIYFTGHGANYDDGKKPQYYYLTHELVSGDLSDPAVRQKATVSSEELTDWINNIPARKQALIFDTCYSGKIVDSLNSKSAIDQTRERAMERMKDRTGTYVLTGSAGDKVSYEASNYGQGLLTYTLLWGMKGTALMQRVNQLEKSVDIMTLFSHSREEVKRLSKEFQVVQIPTLRAPLNVESFDIGIAPEAVRERIKLAMPKPVFVQSNFMNTEGFLDTLNISEGLDQYLAGSIGIGNRPVAIFINVTNFPGAHCVRGLYRKTKTGFTVKGMVYKGAVSLGSFTVEGIGMEDLVPRIAREVEIFAFVKTPYKIPSPEEAVLLEKGAVDDLAAAENSPHFGYKENFIEGFKVPLPGLNSAQKKDIAKLLTPRNGNSTVLHYQYYSVVQSASRRLPFFSACNINGEAFLRLDRKEADMPFITDKRIALEHQIGDEFYKNSVLGEQDKAFTHFFDRGHMTKREDAQWADEQDDALKTVHSARGARLTFFFTNAVPQIGRFNRGIWNSLETYILKTASAVKKGSGNNSYNINLFTGPVLEKADPKVPLNGQLVQIPALFWKVVYYKKDSDDQLYHVGFLISQDPEWEASGLKKKEATAEEEAKLFSEFKNDQPFQVPVSEIARLTGLSFFAAIDPFKGQVQGAAITEQVRLNKRDVGSEVEGLGYQLDGLVL